MPITSTPTSTRTTVYVEAEYARGTVTDVWEFATAEEAARAVNARLGLGLITRVTRIDFPSVDAEVAYNRAVIQAIMPDVAPEVLVRMLDVVREYATKRAETQRAEVAG